VILIIGIVATIAAPRFFDSVGTAKNKSSAQTIEVVRDAIELFRANNSTYPGQDDNQATLKTELAPFLRKEFPTCQVGKNNANVKFSTANPLVVTADAEAWLYNKATGEIRMNHADYIAY
jgi:general secretion pathway protein G